MLLTSYVVVGIYLAQTPIAVSTSVVVNVLFVVAKILCCGSN